MRPRPTAWPLAGRPSNLASAHSKTSSAPGSQRSTCWCRSRSGSPPSPLRPASIPGSSWPCCPRARSRCTWRSRPATASGCPPASCSMTPPTVWSSPPSSTSAAWRPTARWPICWLLLAASRFGACSPIWSRTPRATASPASTPPSSTPGEPSVPSSFLLGMTGQTEDLYAVLGIPRDADQAEVRAAFRRLAWTHHPDHASGASAERMVEINLAYAVLGDAERRRRYDASLALPQEQLWTDESLVEHADDWRQMLEE